MGMRPEHPRDKRSSWPPAHAFGGGTSCVSLSGDVFFDAIRTKTSYDVAADDMRVPLEVLLALPDRLRAEQQVFEKTGGLHAAGLFTAAGELGALREDVGRRNAVDKVIGEAVRAGRLPLARHVLMVSGRASLELTQKAAMAGIPVLAAVSAPSSLAVELAREVASRRSASSGATAATSTRGGSGSPGSEDGAVRPVAPHHTRDTMSAVPTPTGPAPDPQGERCVPDDFRSPSCSWAPGWTSCWEVRLPRPGPTALLSRFRC